MKVDQRRRVLAYIVTLVLCLQMGIGMDVSDSQAAKKAKIAKKKLTLEVGQKEKVSIKNKQKSAKYLFHSSKKKVAAVSKTGKVTAKKKGTAVITVKEKQKKKVTLVGKVKVRVKKAESNAPEAVQTPATAQEPEVTQAPAATNAPAATQTPEAASSLTPAPTTAPVSEPVENLVIDLSGLTTTFTSSPAKIDFSSRIESRFDLKYYSSVKINYEMVFTDDDSSGLNSMKLGLADSQDTLTGYADGISYVYAGTEGSASISLSGDGIEGTAVGLNIQPMNASYSWPDRLESVTITGIEFVAKTDAVYDDPNASAAPTATPEPTYPPTTFTYEGLDTSWIDSSKPMVAFTFDDGPVGNAETDRSMVIQKALKEHNAHATFFYIGSQINSAEKRDEILQAKNNGFEVGNHSYGWNSLSSSKASTIKKSIEDTNTILTEITGYRNFLFRAPNLSISKTMQGYIQAPFINCSVNSLDYTGITADEIYENVIKAGDGDIVLMHEFNTATYEAIDQILDYFDEKGYQVVSVSELFAVRGQTLTTGQTYSSCPPVK